jgi:ATP-dependent Clp protease ATP-binding subunit ClpX
MPDTSSADMPAARAQSASDARLTPRSIVRQLNQHVVGQDDAKKVLAVAAYNHLRRRQTSAASGVRLAKNNVLLIGPSGSGKTLMCETLGRILGVPFVSADATGLTQTRFIGEALEAVLQRLVDAADGDFALAERGIVFLDEIDKLKATPGESRAANGEAVQHALLRAMEGSLVRLRAHESAHWLDTAGILFICGGAFVGLEDVMAANRSYGFISAGGGDDRAILDRLNARVKPTDLFTYGLIPEFTGRLPVIARLSELDRATLIRIMTEPADALLRQYQAMFAAEGVQLDIAERVFEEIADLALEYRTGARGLRGLFEELVTPVLYVIPDQPEVRQVAFTSIYTGPTITRGSARGGA